MNDHQPSTTLQTITIPNPIPSSTSLHPFTPQCTHKNHEIYFLTSLLSPAECTAIQAPHQNLVPANVTPGTVRTREIFEDENLAGMLWERVSGLFSTAEALEGKIGEGGEMAMEGRVVDEDGEIWKVNALNERFRLCFYESGGKFTPHTDGRRLSSLNTQSFMTLNMYLNTVSHSSGGATRFLDPTDAGNWEKVLLKHQPEKGGAAVFRDCVWHDGEVVHGGGEGKWLLRTDIMFERETPFNWSDFCTSRGWNDETDEQREAKGRKALSFAEGLEDAACSEEAVGWYKIAFRAWPALERGG